MPRARRPQQPGHQVSVLPGPGGRPGAAGRRAPGGSVGDERLVMMQPAGNQANGRWLRSLQRSGDEAKGGVLPAEQEAELDVVVKKIKDTGVLELDGSELHVGINKWFTERHGGAANIDVKEEYDSASGHGSGKGGAIYGRGAVSASRNVNAVGMTYDQYQAIAELGAFLAVNAHAEGAARAKLGGSGHVLLAAKTDAFAGLLAKARGQTSVTVKDGRVVGASATGSAKAAAVVTVGLDVSGQIAADPGSAWQGLGTQADIEAFLKAGAEVAASGDLAFDLLRGEVAFSGEASAFVGVKASATVRDSALLYNRKFLSIAVTGEASAGAGGSAKGGVNMRGGKLTFELFASATPGVGVGGGGALEADLKPVGVLIWRMAAKALWKARKRADRGDVQRRVVNYRAELDRKFRPELRLYREMKLEQLRMNRATEYVKIEKVQAILDMAFPRTEMTSLATRKTVTTIDRAIEAVVADELEDADGPGRPEVEVDVKKGKIKVLQFTPRNIASQLGGGIAGVHAKGKDADKLDLPSDVGPR